MPVAPGSRVHELVSWLSGTSEEGRRRAYSAVVTPASQPPRQPGRQSAARACCSLLRCKSSSSSLKILSVRQRGMEFKSGGARAASHSHTHTGVQYLGRDRKVFACPSMRNEWARAGHYFRYRCYSEITNVSPMRQLKLVVAALIL